MRRLLLSSFLAIPVAIAFACSDFDPSSDPPATPDATDATGDTNVVTDGAPSADAAAGLRVAWIREIEIDAGSVGASVAARRSNAGAHLLFTGTGRFANVPTIGSDAVLATYNENGGLVDASAFGGEGTQYEVSFIEDGDGQTFVAWLNDLGGNQFGSTMMRVDNIASVGDSGPLVLPPPNDIKAIVPRPPGGWAYVGQKGTQAIIGQGKPPAPEARAFGDGGRPATFHTAASVGNGTVAGGSTAGVLDLGCAAKVTPDGAAMPRVGFVTKFDLDGNCQWVDFYPSGGEGEVNAVASLPDGVIVGGHFKGTFNDTLTVSEDGVFFARLDGVGKRKWIRAIRSTGRTRVTGIAVDQARQRFVIVGIVNDRIEIDGHVLQAKGGGSAYVLVLDGNGSYVDSLAFGKTTVPNDYVAAWDVGVSSDGTIYVGGTAYGVSTLDLPGTRPAPPSSFSRSFLMRLDQ